MNEIETFFEKQLSLWKSVEKNFHDLEHIREKELRVDGFSMRVQYNPGRIRSTAVRIDKASLERRKCFLCTVNLPPQQEVYRFDFTEKYVLLVNPYPIFPIHFTLPDVSHLRQSIKGRYGDMLDLSREMGNFILFYNGPLCGASAPDHAHFQAGIKGFLPLEKRLVEIEKKKIYSGTDLDLFILENYPCRGFVFSASGKDELCRTFLRLYDCLPFGKEDYEPKLNLLTWTEGERWITCLFPRIKHRPDCYFEEGPGKILISPASVELGGVLSFPREEDFLKVKSSDLESIFKEVCMPEKMQEDIIKKFL